MTNIQQIKETFHCDYCNKVKDYEKDHYETWGTGMQECNCCAKACKCHPQCNCYINNANCPECATTQYALIHGGEPKILDCSCGQQDEYGVDFGTHTVCIKCTPMKATVEINK